MSFVKKILKNTIVVLMVLMISAVPALAADNESSSMIQPRYNNVGSATITLGFDGNNVAYCSISVTPYNHGSGISGVMKLFNSDGDCIAIWSVSDYERPIAAEFTHQCTYGETYTLTFEGYAYSNNQTAADRLELSTTNTCVN